MNPPGNGTGRRADPDSSILQEPASTGRVKVGTCVIVGNPGDGDDCRGSASLAEVLADLRGWDRPPENVRRDADYPAVLDAERVNTKARIVFHMLAESQGGARNKDIARDLGVSPGRATQLKTILATALERHGYRCPLGCSSSERSRGKG